MFDEIEINGKKVRIYFDIEKFKLKIDRYDFTTIDPNFNPSYIKIKNFVLFLKYLGQHNNYSYEYDVLFYIHCDYTEFSPIHINRILISSEEISYLLYSETNKKKKEYLIDKGEYEFKVVFNRSNKIQRWYYNDIKTGGNVQINIAKCKDWETYSKIVVAVIDAISVASLNRKNNDFEILLCGEKDNYIGSIIFPKIDSNEKHFSIGNIDIIKNDIQKIISTLVESPLESQYIIPRYSNYYNQLEFYKLYACFEFEYKKIDKSKMYSNEQKRDVRRSNNMKTKIIKLLKESSIDITEHYYNSLNNYNPQEGHKQKLKNAVEYSKKFFSERYHDMNFNGKEKSFIDYIYKTRIKIIHEPDNNINIENSNFMSVFNELVYSLFLKRCGISNKRLQTICKKILIQYI